jgi:hypothetical protein
MTTEMWTHENSTLEFRQGYREGLEAAIKLVDEYKQELKADRKINECLWVNVCTERLNDELSMYEVGDEE